MASSSDYTIQPTDPGKSPFIIKAYSTNGPATPNNETPLYTSAVSANTSLVLLGKGMFDYGEPIQTDLVHLLENFANSTAPAKSIQGQLWYNNITDQLSVYSGSSWNNILTNGSLVSPLNLNNQKIINVGIPSDPLDSANLQYLVDYYLPLTGGTLSGNIIMGALDNIIIPAAPSSATHSTNKLYVDTQITNSISSLSGNYIEKSGSTGITGNFSWDTASLTFSDSTLILTNSNIQGNLLIVGDVNITGNFSISGTTPAGYLNIGINRLQNVVDPINLQDAATKHYIDNIISGLSIGGTADGTLSSGTYNKIAGILTLNSTIGPNVIISNFFTASDIPVISASDNNVYNSLSTTNNDSWLAENLYGKNGYPKNTLQDTFNVIDDRLSDLYSPRKRYINSVTLPNQLTIILPFNYKVEQHTLHVTINGVKQYNSVRAYSTITLPSTAKNIDSLPLVVSTSYSFNITVDSGIPQNISVSISPGTTYNIIQITDINNFTIVGDATNTIYVGQHIQTTSPSPYNVCNGIYTITSLTFDGTNTNIVVLENNHVTDVPAGSGFVPSGTVIPIPLYTYIELVNQINLLLVGAVCVFDNTPELAIYSNTSGSTSNVLLTDINLFSTLSGTISNNGVGTNYGYIEVGNAYSLSNTITFATDPGVGKVIEVVDYK